MSKRTAKPRARLQTLVVPSEIVSSEISNDSTAKEPPRVAWPHIGIGILGLGVSLYAHHLHNLVKAGRETGCSFSDTISCDKVIGSQWGEFAGISLGIYGALFWILVLITSISGAKVAPKTAALQRLGLATIGLFSVLGLAYIAYFVIRGFCPVCFATHVLTVFNFVFALWSFWKLRKSALR